MTDRIRVKNLAIYARHGVFRAEQEIGQRFYLDITVETDLAVAARSDDIADTINYADLVASATAAFTERTERLLETLAERVAVRVLSDFPRATAVEIAIRKPGAPIEAVFDHVGIEIRRVRNG